MKDQQFSNYKNDEQHIEELEVFSQDKVVSDWLEL